MLITHEKPELEAKAHLAVTLGAQVTITGYWVWASFSAIPASATRTALKEAGFRWMRHKQKWAFRGALCTSRASMSWEYITDKYGEEVVA